MTGPAGSRLDLATIRARWPLEALAERYGVRLRGQGGRRYGRCPFHADRTPSLVVYVATQSFFCFGCGAWGDAVDWVARLEGVNFRAACELLGGPPPPPRPIRPAPVSPRDTFTEALPAWALGTLNLAAEVYHQALRRAPEAFAFLRSRGIGPEVVRWARLGYATGSDLRRALVERGRSADGVRLGLLNAHTGREVLRGRLVVPVVQDGQVLTLTGRAVAPGLDRRYLDLPLPPHLLGADLVRGARRPVLVEGVTDVRFVPSKLGVTTQGMRG